MQENHLKTSKTARYFTFGVLTSNTSEVWICLHGYGQLASDLLEKLSFLKADNRFIVAPEGLSKFYWKGFGGEPVASWMTKEMREHEISDYVNYLNELLEKLALTKNCKLVLYGFSQGVATLGRWLLHGNVQPSKVIFNSGSLPTEIAELQNFNQWSFPVFYCYGLSDRFLTEEVIEKQKMLLAKVSSYYKIVPFKGKHEVYKEILALNA